MIKKTLKKWCGGLVSSIKENKAFYGFALLACFIPALYVTVMMQKTLPFAEGWYTYYAQCINGGLTPYVDFEYLYSPIYLYFTALFTRVFGYGILAIRSLGILFFALISLGLYLSVTVVVGKKRSFIALVAALTGVFYLQTEIVQVFYDYVRLMDACAAFSLYFLLKSVKAMVEKKPAMKHLVPLGLLLALFANIKQNTGLVFLAFSVVLVAYVGVWCKESVKNVIKSLAVLLVPFGVLSAIVYGALFKAGALSAYLSMTGLSAASAKGGMNAILFGWLFNNARSFLTALPVAGGLLVLLVGLYFLRHRFMTKSADGEKTTVTIGFWVGVVFSACLTLGILLFMWLGGFTRAVVFSYNVSPYSVFLVVAPIFLALGVWGVVDIVRKQRTLEPLMLPFSLAGAYFAIAFACGNSGGIAEGQSSFGIAFIVMALMLLLDYGHAVWGRVGVGALALFMSLQFAGRKMVSTYNWWGMNESDYWSSTETLDFPILKGIKVSPETKYAYESICREIMANTGESDPIFCFPNIPLIYVLTGRSDPGTFTKVQWFDVATDASVLADIEVLKQNPPKAILIYNTSDGAYSAHENAFRGGNESGTRVMREFLYNYVSDNGYRFCGRYVANNNSLSLWIFDQSGSTAPMNFERGDGTKENPYVIKTPAQMKYFADMVAAGRTFNGQYIRQEGDIDMTGYEFAPIGNPLEGTAFTGYYDGAGYTVKNVYVPADVVAELTVDEHGDAVELTFFTSPLGTAENMNFENCPFVRAILPDEEELTVEEPTE